jgi:hypothetical protein
VFKVRAVVEVTSLAPTLHQMSLDQAFEVERQGGRWKIEATGELGGGIPLGTSFHQQPEDREAGLRRKGAQGGDGFVIFHSSNYMELVSGLQRTPLD